MFESVLSLEECLEVSYYWKSVLKCIITGKVFVSVILLVGYIEVSFYNNSV